MDVKLSLDGRTALSTTCQIYPSAQPFASLLQFKPLQKRTCSLRPTMIRLRSGDLWERRIRDRQIIRSLFFDSDVHDEDKFGSFLPLNEHRH